MKLLSRLITSIQDGSLAFKLLNRISPIEYVPGPEKAINEYLKEHYPQGKAWETMSAMGRKVWVQFHPLFDRHKIQVIAYVGANEGATALTLNEVFPGCIFYLFEPVPQTFAILFKKVGHLKNMHCINVAIGGREEEKQMFVDDYSPASSLLPYNPIALEEYPFLGKQHNLKVHVKSLDFVMREMKVTNVDLLLMDAQGYENEVLLGAKETLRSCKVVISELSLQALYSDSSSFDSVYQELVRQGFQLQYLINPMQGGSQQILQIDGIFVRDIHE